MVELALVIVGGVLLLALVVGGTLVCRDWVKADAAARALYLASMRDLAVRWSVHSMQHSEHDLEKLRFLLEGSATDADLPQTRKAPPPAPPPLNQHEGMTATFPGDGDTMG